MSDEIKHSPEPWQAHNGHWEVVDRDGGLVADVFCAMDDKDPGANRRRIVAAVNACAGISTEVLESGALADLLKHVRRFMYRPDGISDSEWYDRCATQEANILADLARLGMAE